jgi:hypothetical protein
VHDGRVVGLLGDGENSGKGQRQGEETKTYFFIRESVAAALVSVSVVTTKAIRDMIFSNL